MRSCAIAAWMTRIGSASLERFGQEVNRARLHCTHRGGNIAVSRDEHNVGVRPLLRLVEQVQAIDVRKVYVQNETRRYVWFRIRKVLRSGPKRDHMQIESRQQLGQRFANPTVIIHDKHDMVSRIHSRQDAPLVSEKSIARGSASPSCLGCVIRSACASATCRWRVLFRPKRPAVPRPRG